MKEKLMSYKKIIICACAAVAVIAVAAVVLLTGKEETYRSILVYDVQGSAVIERASVGTMDAVENLYLESGDRVSVASDSGLRMKLDDDKYVMAEADTVFSVEAEGTDADSRTKICLEQGAVTNEIQHPLSEGSAYETSTPNSVMAVRGTIYRAELYIDENSDNEDPITKLCCFQGNVGTKPVLPDGTYGEEVTVPAGSELTVYQDGTVGEVQDIAYDELPVQAVTNLIALAESGQSLTGITLEELQQLAAGTEDVGEAPEDGAVQAEQTEDEAVQPDPDEEDVENDAETEAEEEIPARKDAVKNKPTNPAPKEQKAPAPEPSKAVKPAADSNNQTGGGDSQNGDSGSNDGGTDQNKPEKPDKPAKPKTYTVTFLYQGEVFATQTVKSGEKAAAPVLTPASGGAWDFDFETKIQANTTISWN